MPGRRLFALLCFLGISAAGADPVSDQRLQQAALEPEQWLSHGRDPQETRFSPLTEVTADNVAGLGLAWHLDLPDTAGLEATPVVADGVLYVTGNWNRLYAVDAASGKLLWQYDPGVDRRRSIGFCCGVVNRGVALWGDRVLLGTLDGYLVAVDRGTGQEVWRTLTVDPAQPYSITGAPRVANGVVVIGNGGAEFGVRGYVGGYDPQSGEQLWRFYTVPGNPALGFENPQMEAAAKTWSGEWWTMGGGGTVWDSMAYDPELDLLYVGVGNGGPHNRNMRSPGGGDNLFLSSIVALRPRTGEYVWHYQQTPAESWDYTATQHIILADIPWRGQVRKVLLQAPKNGFFFVIDRVSGELLSAEPYVPVSWATHYDLATGRPVETAGADYLDGPFQLRPSGLGGHNWHPMAWSPVTGLVYIPATDFAAPLEDEGEYRWLKRHWNLGYKVNPSPFGHLLTQALVRRSMQSWLMAWDPRLQREVWRSPNPLIGNGGVLATGGGLVFQGDTANRFNAYDAASGSRLWSFDAQQAVMAAPVSYAVDGVQFVAVLAGRGGGLSMNIGLEPPPSTTVRRLLGFRLGGGDSLPPMVESAWPQPPALASTAEQVERGAVLYSRYCSRCHGAHVVSDGSIPDLRRLSRQWYDDFDGVVRGGGMEAAGMPRFDDVLDLAAAEDVKAYVVYKANEDYELRQSPAWWLDLRRWWYDKLAAALLLFAG